MDKFCMKHNLAYHGVLSDLFCISNLYHHNKTGFVDGSHVHSSYILSLKSVLRMLLGRKQTLLR